MDDIPAVVINYRREIIPAPTLDFEIRKVGLPHLIGKFSLIMELTHRLQGQNHAPYVPTDLFHAKYDKSLTLKRISDSLPIRGLIILWG